MQYLQSAVSNENANAVVFRPFLVGVVVTACLFSPPHLPLSSFREQSKIAVISLPKFETENLSKRSTQSELLPISPSRALSQIKLLTGFTQDQIADLFGVDRRSIYHWLDGQEPTDANNEKIMRVLSSLIYMDRGLSSVNKRLLLAPVEGGNLLKDHLVNDEFEEFKKKAGAGGQRPMLQIKAPKYSPLQKGKATLSDMLPD